MNILVDGQTFESAEINRGIGVYFKNVLNNMVKRSYGHNWFVSVGDARAIECLDPWVARQIKPIVSAVFSPGFDYERTVRYREGLKEIVADHAIDLYWNPNPFMVNVLFPDQSIGCPMYITIYDIIPAVMPVVDWSESVKKEYFRRFDVFRNESNIYAVCISKSTANDAKKYIFENIKTKVIMAAADSQSFYKKRERGGVDKEPFVLFTGGFDYRKNMDAAVEAFSLAVKEYPDNEALQNAKFYIVCNYDEASKDKFDKKLMGLKLENRVELLGFISNEKLAELYATADVFFYPSLYEGFGLPLVEAMQGGAYILAADNSSLPEVCGSHGLFCDAASVKDMADKLNTAFLNAAMESAEDKQARQRHALSFSWEKAADETLSYFEEINAASSERMRVAIVTPWPNQHTGVANYVYKLLPFLIKYFSVDIFVDDTVDASEWAEIKEGGLYSIKELPQRHREYDHIIYQFGNSSDFHSGIYRMARLYPGIGEIHDYILHHFFYHAYYLKGEKHIYADALEAAYGHEGRAHYENVDRGNCSPDDITYPMSHTISKMSYGTIVHNKWSYEQLNESSAFVIPHACLEKEAMPKQEFLEIKKNIKEKIRFKEGEFLIGCLGFVNYNKRPEQIVAVVKSLFRNGYRIRAIFCGQAADDRLERFIAKHNLQDVVVITGYIDKKEYEVALQMCDLVVNLRYPSMGESSGTLCETLKYGKPALVSDVNQYREFPDDVCWKVPLGKYETPVLEYMIEYLFLHKDVRNKLGENARKYADTVLRPEKIARQYYRTLQRLPKRAKTRDAITKPLALVIPWYGDNIRGGAEQACNYLAHSLTLAGVKVEVFTTCVKDAASDRGKNTLPQGTFVESGIVVRRFPVRERNVAAFAESNLKIYHNKPWDGHDEEIYFKEDINSPQMYSFIRERKDDYHCFIFIPYMYGPTYNGSKECPEKAILIPCLHDESYARMGLVKQCIERFKGVVFHAKPEADLAHRLYNLHFIKTAILGVGIDSDWIDQCDPARFRKKYDIHDDFILYAGRKDEDKKVDELINFFKEYKSVRPFSALKLVLIGGGEMDVDSSLRNEIIDLGFISPEDKRDAFSAASIFCNPSRLESFSIVIMESWLAKRPVIVSGHCAVTTQFCRETNGGFSYLNFYEFGECVDRLLANPDMAAAMGKSGFEYVTRHFTHKAVAEKYLRFIEDVV
jgi:glycosyltransferase involved in cell wall biosynthesis